MFPVSLYDPGCLEFWNAYAFSTIYQDPSVGEMAGFYILSAKWG